MLDTTIHQKKQHNIMGHDPMIIYPYYFQDTSALKMEVLLKYTSSAKSWRIYNMIIYELTNLFTLNNYC
jgi:hypothetical protein